MDSIRIRTLTRWKYYLILFGTLPIDFLAVLLIHKSGGHRYLLYATAVLLLLSFVSLAHVVARKWTTFSFEERKVQCDGETLEMDYPASYYIRDEGIGVTQFEIKLKSEKKVKILVPKYSKNADKLEGFLERVCNELNQVK
jgi:hypothetical protein